jgi:hypothetical protein
LTATRRDGNEECEVRVMETRSGTRLRCDHCGSEIIVLKAANPVVECCGQLMDAIFVPASGGADGSPEHP